jgi:hypothetical protein
VEAKTGRLIWNQSGIGGAASTIRPRSISASASAAAPTIA